MIIKKKSFLIKTENKDLLTIEDYCKSGKINRFCK